jgi:hypothetical protein
MLTFLTMHTVKNALGITLVLINVQFVMEETDGGLTKMESVHKSHAEPKSKDCVLNAISFT